MPPEVVRRAFEAGVKTFGENRAQEGLEKVEALPDATWHFIGSLQRNKARRVAEAFALIHSVDSLRLGQTLARIGAERGRPVEALVQVRLGGEETKSGVEPDDVLPLLRDLSSHDGLSILGLMSVPPFDPDPENIRPHFRRLAELAREAERLDLSNVAMRHLSMGMSSDFEVAIEEGATFVRVGTAIFGPRE